MQIHPELQSAKSHPLPSNRWILAAMQTFLRLVNRLHRQKFKHLMTRASIRSPDGYLVPTVIIKPAQTQHSMPALVYFHGGAFVMEGAPAHFENAVRYAGEASCTVIYVEYRLAPQHIFPAGFNDCYAALEWTAANAALLGIDAARIAVGGDSAGGCLAAGVAQRALQEERLDIKGQLLLYPAVDLLCTRPSMARFKDTPPFKDLSASGIAKMYLGRAASKPLPPYSSPIDGSVKGLPPVYMETPQFDPLHDQGLEYAHKLMEAGVPVELHDLPGAIHGFDIVAPKSSVAHDAMTQRIQFLQRIFATPRSARTQAA
jgi:acetyl esterase/lipase